jgi:hypothetical protein
MQLVPVCDNIAFSVKEYENSCALHLLFDRRIIFRLRSHGGLNCLDAGRS